MLDAVVSTWTAVHVDVDRGTFSVCAGYRAPLCCQYIGFEELYCHRFGSEVLYCHPVGSEELYCHPEIHYLFIANISLIVY